MSDDDSRQQVDDERILGSVRELMTETNPVVSTTELVEVLPIGRRAIQKRLNALLDAEETLVRKKVGGRAVVWWLSDAISITGDEGGEEDRES